MTGRWPHSKVDFTGKTVGIIGTEVDAVVVAQLLEAYPDVSLDGLHEVAQMDSAIGVG